METAAEETSALAVLERFLADELDAEKYGETSVGSVLDAIDLEVGFGLDARGRKTTLPVVERNCSNTYKHAVPKVGYVEINGGRYLLPRPAEADFEWLSEETVKVMRARFLLLRDYYYPRLPSLGEAMRQEVVAKFFGGAVFYLSVAGEQGDGG